MLIDNNPIPKSSFLSMEKDMHIIVNKLLQNERFKKLLFYNTPDCLKKANVSQEDSIKMLGKQIKIVPKLTVDNEELNYVIISFDKFYKNMSNPEFRDNVIEFDIICHLDSWNLGDFQLRPYKIAAELDSMFNDKHLTGIGKLEFVGASQVILSDEFAGICLLYQAIHGEEDKINMPNPKDQKSFEEAFREAINIYG